MSEPVATIPVVANQPESGVISEPVAPATVPDGDPNATNTAGQVPAALPEGEKPEVDTPEEQAAKRARRDQNKLNKAYRRAAEAEARAQFLEKKLQESTPAPEIHGAPRLEDFSSVEEYAKAVEKHASEKTTKELESKRAADAQQQYSQRLLSDWAAKVAAAEAKYDDFDEVVGDIKPTSALFVAIMEADNGPDIAHYLGTHQDEAKTLVQLSPLGQARAIGRLEAKLAAEPAKPKTPSQAPAPIKPVGGKSGGANDMPQDSDDIKTWMKKEEARVRKLNA